MKARLIGFALVMIVLGALFVLTNQSNTALTPQPMQSSPSDSDFKGLKIQ